jgi:hypothetical protein
MTHRPPRLTDADALRLWQARDEHRLQGCLRAVLVGIAGMWGLTIGVHWGLGWGVVVAIGVWCGLRWVVWRGIPTLCKACVRRWRAWGRP